MPAYLIVCRLGPAPPGKLPPWGGVLDVADEHGLIALAVDPPGVRALPQGMLWGRFEDADGALAALEAALDGASDLLGYRITARGRAACPVEKALATSPGGGADSACPPSSSSIPSGPIDFLRLVGGRG